MQVFHSTNEKLFEKEFFPSFLAKRGKGDLFEEKICDGINGLNFIPSDYKIKSIVDKGGWETLDKLTAELNIDFNNTLSDTLKFELFGTALVPNMNVTIDSFEENIRTRNSIITKLGILTPIVTVSKGVMISYRHEQKVDIFETIPTNEDFLKDCINIIAAIRSNLFLLDCFSHNYSFRNTINFSRDSFISHLYQDFTFENNFGIIGDRLYWKNITQDLAYLNSVADNIEAGINQHLELSNRPTYQQILMSCMVKCEALINNNLN